MSPRECAHKSFFDIHPVTGATIEVFYADRSLETFGWVGAGWLASPARVCVYGTGERPVSDELLSLSRCLSQNFLGASLGAGVGIKSYSRISS